MEQDDLRKYYTYNLPLLKLMGLLALIGLAATIMLPYVL